MAKRILNLDLLLGIVIILIFIGFSYIGPRIFEELERYVYDVEMRFSQAEEQDVGQIVLIDIDDKSLSMLGAWPWPRYLLAEMTNILKGRGAKLIGLNIPFIEKETNQGLTELKAFREILNAYPLKAKDATMTAWILENLKKMEENLDNDRRLVESARQCGNVILPVYSQFESSQDRVERREDSFLFQNFLTSYNVSDSLKKRLSVLQISSPFPELAQTVLGLGHGNLTFDQNMGGRSHPMFINHKGSLLPSFPLRLAIAYLNQQPKEILVEDNQIRLKDHIIPIINGEMLVKFQNGQSAFPRYSFVDILQAKQRPNHLLEGRIIVIGLSTRESRRINTPVSPRMPESELIANILGNILNNSYINRPSFLSYIEYLAIFLLGGIASCLFPRMRQLRRLGWAVLLVVVTLAAGMILFIKMGIWFKTVYIACCLITIYLMISAREFFLIEGISGGEIETNRLVGLNFQSQGLLDIAFDKFRKLPLDMEAKDLIYDLGLEYERNEMFNKALSVFEYINKGGGYRDLHNRIPKLKESVKSSPIGSHEETIGTSILADSSAEPRSKIGRYKILEELGRGTMGLVYKALDPKINRLLAIKTIRFSDEFDDDVIQEIKDRFFLEAEIAGKLSHPSIVTIYDVGEEGDLTYMVMEFLEGKDLDKFIIKQNLLPFMKVLDVISKVADALDFAHKAGVIHRDIKPANIMLLKNDGVKVTDFGIAKAISSSRTRTGVILGTPNYMSPEQIMGQKIDPRSDVFSLGVLLFQLLTGELPFHGDNLSSLLYEITQVKHPPVRNYDPKIPKVCEQIIDKALAKEPKDRFKSAGEMARVILLLASKINQLRKKRPNKKQLGPSP